MRRSTKTKKRSTHKKQKFRPKQRSRRIVGRKRQSNRRTRVEHVAPRNAKQYFARSRQFQDIWDRVVQVPGMMRSQALHLKRASEQLGLSPNVVLRLAPTAFRKGKNGKYLAKRSDRLLRVVVIPGEKGLREIVLRDSRQASLVGEYWNAVEKTLSRGDASELQKFKRKRVTDASGKRIRLVTDLDVLGRQASAGVLQFESIYGRTA